MIVKDLFNLCNTDEIIKEIAKLENRNIYEVEDFIKLFDNRRYIHYINYKYNYYYKKRKNRIKVYTNTILEKFENVKKYNRFKRINKLFIEEVVKKIKPKETDGIIIGIVNMDSILEDIDRFRVNAELFKKSELKETFRKDSTLDNIKDIGTLTDDEIYFLLEILRGISYIDADEQLKNIDEDNYNKLDNVEKDKLIEEIMNNNKGLLPESYAYEFSEWEEILGYEVIEENVKSVGIAKVLAYIIYEMTFFGYDRKMVDEEVKKLDNAIEEINKVKELPIEEQEKYFKSVDLEKEFGYVDKRSDEQKDFENHMFIRKNFYNLWITYKTISSYWNNIDKTEATK